jgi:predicted Zn-dependent peptidase
MSFQVKNQVLANGLTVVKIPMATESVTAMVMVRVGSRDESAKINGISHFLEHMVFKGTKKWPTPMEMNRVIESVGGVFNAFTSQEMTAFWMKIGKKHLELGLEFLHQAVFEPLLPADELEKERGVILEEIKMYEDNPMRNVAQSFVSQVYSATQLGQLVIGPAENIKSLGHKEFVKYLDYWYQPANMVLVLAGGGLETAEKQIEEVFVSNRKGKIKFTDKPNQVVVKQEKARVKLVKKPIQQAHFCLGMETFKSTDPDRYNLMMLNTILGGNTSSRLWDEIREKRGLVYYVRSSIDLLLDTGYLVTQAGCDAKRVDEAIKVVRGEYQKIETVSEVELKRAKEYLKGRIDLSLEDSQSVANLFGENLLMENEIRTVEKIKAKIDEVSVAGISKTAKRVFEENKLNLTVLGDFKDKARFEKLVG